MKKNLTEMVFLLDRSGSMEGLEKDTIGGFNSLIAKQKKVKGSAKITTVLFDNEYEVLHNRIDLKEVVAMTADQYFVRGSTALLDSVGKTIQDIGKALAKTHEDNRPEKVIFVIITDGMENASNKFSQQQIKDMIEHQKAKYNWEFMFLGANIDAVAVAESYGISEDRAVEFLCDEIGTELNFKIVSETVDCMRNSIKVDESWKQEIEADLKKRGNKQ